MALRPIIVTVLIFLIAIYASIKIYSFFHRPLVHHLSADLQVVGIIKNDNSHEVNTNSILNGEDSVLIVDHAPLLYQQILQKIPQAKYLSQEEVFNTSNLHLFDKNSDGVITSQDPIFNHLFIVKFYSNNLQDDIKSLSAAGIRGINLSMTPTGDHEVLMSDGSTRTLYSESKLEKPE